MNWAKRLARVFLGNASLPSSRRKTAQRPRTRRVAVEPLEDRRLLSATGTFDFGDLPDNYGTTLVADGARHEAVGPTLGALRDTEGDGLPTVDASGDDTSGSADEDGVTFGTIQVGQLDATVTVNVQNAPSGAKLDAWIDFNGDGSFGGAGEQIADTLDVAAGDKVIEFDVPSWADSGQVYARFRLSTTGDLAPRGEAVDGEVEDYQVTIDAPASVGAGFVPQDPLTGEVGGVRDVIAVDIDDDGDMDVLSASYQDDKIAWFENDGAGRFTAHTITTSADVASSVFAADVDGDGDVDVLSASAGDDKIAWYENDGNENFTTHIISLSAEYAVVFAEDVDGDGDMDILSSSQDAITWYENDGNENFRSHIVGEAVGPQSVIAADMDGDGDMDVLCSAFLESTKGDKEIVWYENDGEESFVAHTLVAPDFSLSSLVVEDIDGDGDMDILANSLNESDSLDNEIIPWFENDGNQTFTIRYVTTDVGANSVAASDMDGDGDIDVLAASRTDGVAWYENDGNEDFSPHAVYPAGSLDALKVCVADMNGDGDADVVSASWYVIDWCDDNGDGTFTSHTIAAGAGLAEAVSTADIDGDGDMDILSASFSDDRIAWYENDNQVFTQHTITASAGGARSVFSADLDGDGDLDVVSAAQSDDTIAWYENDGTGSFIAHTVTIGADRASCVYAADIDEDGDIDLLVAAAGLGKVVWYENDGNTSFTYHLITASADGAASVYAADVDGDGDMDVISGASDASAPRQGRSNVVWYENDGNESFTTHMTDSREWYVYAVSAVDVDGDGDMDLLSAGSDGVVWYENDGNRNFTLHSLQVRGTCTVMAADIDGDGDLDLVSTTRAEDGHRLWYENDGHGVFTAREFPSTVGSLSSIFVADVDGDADLDLLSASYNNPGTILWYEQVAPIDYGDAPDTYGTTLAADGARHGTTGPMLGSLRDSDSDGMPLSGADGDDGTVEADEDGVSFDSLIIVGSSDRAGDGERSGGPQWRQIGCLD